MNDSDGFGDNDAGYGGGSQSDAGAQSDAQSSENGSQGVGDMGGGFDPSSPDFSVPQAGPDPTQSMGSVGDSVSPADIDYGFRSAEAVSQQMSAAHSAFDQGNYGAALGYAVGALGSAALGQLGNALGAIGADIGGKLGLGIGLGLIGLGSTAGIVGVVAMGLIGATLGKKGMTQLGQDMATAIGLGYTHNQAIGQAIDGLDIGQDGAESVLNYLDKFANADESTQVKMLSDLFKEGSEGEQQNNLYRRRSNIIGTGRQGLTIE